MYRHADGVPGGLQGGQVNEVVIPHPLILKIPQIIPADDKTFPVPQFHRGQIGRVAAAGILHPGGPVAAVRLGPDGPHVAAHIEQSAGQPPLPGGPGGHLGGVALADGSHIQTQLRVSEGHGAGVGIQQQVGNVHVLCGGLQGGILGRNRRFQLAGVMPQTQHRAGGHVAGPVGAAVHLHGKLQKFHQFAVHRHGRLPGGLVHIIQVDDPIIVVVDVKQLMIAQKVLMEGLRLAVPFLLAGGVALHDGHGVEHIKPAGGVTLELWLAAAKPQRHGTGQHQRPQAFHRRPPMASCSRCSSSNKAPSVQPLLVGVTMARSGNCIPQALTASRN